MRDGHRRKKNQARDFIMHIVLYIVLNLLRGNWIWDDFSSPFQNTLTNIMSREKKEGAVENNPQKIRWDWVINFELH